ncbi:MAG TPA: hypothetical protein VL832_07000 [Puia sp.]|jgi:hypothetical protein|nr:hypothetical protein [Puia sp.]
MKRIVAIVTGITEEETYSMTGLVIAFIAGCLTAFVFCHFLIK